MVSKKKFEDMFYDPLECRPFYKDKEAPIWFGRVEKLTPSNQKIFVYGFVTSALNEAIDDNGQPLSLEYSM